MDWSTRDSRPTQNTNQPAPAVGTTKNAPAPGRSKRSDLNFLRLASVTLLFSATILVVALIWSVILGTSAKGEGKYVGGKQMQAVFLNSGQVYFGHIKSLNDKYLRVTDIYYLRINQQVQPNGQQQTGAPELVKLGCELHRPSDEMLINREQVSFWENLKDDGAENTVPGAVKKYIAANPNGRKCEQPAAGQSSNTNNSNNTTPAAPTTTPTTTTPTTTPAKKP